MFPGINFVILSLFASPQFCEYTSTMSNVQRFSRAPRELTGGFNYSWLTGKNYAQPHGWSHLCEQSSDDASSLNGLLLHESKRDRNGVTRNSDRHTYIRRPNVWADSFSFFPTYASCREDDLHVWKLRLCLRAKTSSRSSVSTFAPVLFTHV